MTRKAPLQALFYLNVSIVALLIGYKIYLNYFNEAFEAVHTEQLLAIEERLQNKESFSFAVVGNINNSVGIFERTFIPMLNQSGLDFLVSAGNAVSSGSEDKYRSLYGTLTKLDIPYLLTFGANEYTSFGSFRFYEHFGPHLYSVRIGESRLIFLDSTGKTPYRWQLHWLRDLLLNDDAMHTLVFIGHPLLYVAQQTLFEQEEDYLGPSDFREELLSLFATHRIDVVFSANLSLFSEQQIGPTRFITTGGAGGLILNDEESFYHYIKVDVTPQGIATELMPMEIGQHPLLKRLESLWFFIYSLFYVGYLNFLLLVSLFSLLAIRLYTLIFVDRDYYRDFDADPSPWLEKPLRIAMFTNNYLPFIGGVPISIERLRGGLEAMGNKTLIIAPRYRDQPPAEERVLRVPSLLSMGEKREFRLANIFLPRISRQLRSFKPDVIHVHHPVWLGSLGLFLARRLRIPVVFTYHTRLEHYAHFVPLPGSLFRNFISHALIKRFANKCDGIIVPTYSAEEYLRIIGVKTTTFVQPTGIDFERYQDITSEQLGQLRGELGLQDETVLISVSRLSNEKNLDFIIDAVASLRRTLERPFRLLLIGEGHQRNRLQKRIDEMDLQNSITLIGAVPASQMAIYYNLGDLFVFASKSETQGMVILEAMAAGLPVVAIRSSGIDDVITHGHNGYKTPESQSQWQAAVSELITNVDLRQTLSGHARDFARGFSVEKFANDIKGVYAEVLAKKIHTPDVGTTKD